MESEVGGGLGRGSRANLARLRWRADAKVDGGEWVPDGSQVERRPGATVDPKLGRVGAVMAVEIGSGGRPAVGAEQGRRGEREGRRGERATVEFGDQRRWGNRTAAGGKKEAEILAR